MCVFVVNILWMCVFVFVYFRAFSGWYSYASNIFLFLFMIVVVFVRFFFEYLIVMYVLSVVVVLCLCVNVLVYLRYVFVEGRLSLFSMMLMCVCVFMNVGDVCDIVCVCENDVCVCEDDVCVRMWMVMMDVVVVCIVRVEVCCRWRNARREGKNIVCVMVCLSINNLLDGI